LLLASRRSLRERQQASLVQALLQQALLALAQPLPELRTAWQKP
jgi:hypothetical protein